MASSPRGEGRSSRRQTANCLREPLHKIDGLPCDGQSHPFRTILDSWSISGPSSHVGRRLLR
jgi:hypothetical protein